jgi:hypothetical protein
VLEIKIGSGSFTDIVSAGGRFVTGGYNTRISQSYQNPLAGRESWGGDSGRFITTIIDLPPSAAGQTVQFQWRCATDSGRASIGWRIDSVSVIGYWCCPDLAPPPPFVPAAGFYSGLFYEPAGVTFLRSGALSLTTTAGGAYSGSLQMGRNLCRFSGICDAFGSISNRLWVTGVGYLTLVLQIDTTDNAQMFGTVNGGSWLAEAQVVRAADFSITNLAPYSPRLTLVIPGNGDAGNTNVPFGNGYGAVTVSSLGVVRLLGAMGDGTAINLVTRISSEGSWPVYASLYGGTGQVLGWLNFDSSSAQAGLTGSLQWHKTPMAGSRYYPAGFDLEITNLLGSPYNPSLTPVTGFSQAQVEFTGGDLRTRVDGVFTISSNNRILTASNNQILLQFVPSLGLFSGKVVDMTTRTIVPFRGAILQDQSSGSGFFLGTRLAGRVTLNAN